AYIWYVPLQSKMNACPIGSLSKTISSVKTSLGPSFCGERGDSDGPGVKISGKKAESDSVSISLKSRSRAVGFKFGEEISGSTRPSFHLLTQPMSRSCASTDRSPNRFD